MSSVLGAAHLKRAPESADCCPEGQTPWLDRINREACAAHLVEAVRTNAVSERPPDLFVQRSEILSQLLTSPGTLISRALQEGPLSTPPRSGSSLPLLSSHPVTSLCGTAFSCNTWGLNSYEAFSFNVPVSYTYAFPVTEATAVFQLLNGPSLFDFHHKHYYNNCCILLICLSPYLFVVLPLLKYLIHESRDPVLFLTGTQWGPKKRVNALVLCVFPRCDTCSDPLRLCCPLQ